MLGQEIQCPTMLLHREFEGSLLDVGEAFLFFIVIY
jgi:hypothetical protein